MKGLGIMRKIHTLSIFAVLVFVISFSVPGVFAAPSLSPPSPLMGPVGSTVTISGIGFTAGNTVYVFFDNTRVDSVSVASDGSINISFPVPSTTLGPHTISISDNPNSINLLASTQFTVTSPPPSIPEFPFSFSLVIIFVAVAAVYIVIRQKMTTNFKPF